MAYEDLGNLERLDLSKLSVSDIKELKDESLKKTLMAAAERGKKDGRLPSPSHQDHNSHGDHSTSLAT